MNFVKRIQIENFQSHAKTIIEPALPGQLTIITGPSDSGKTALLRALRWLYVNEPDGDSFIRVGATFARVTAEHAEHKGVGGEGNSSVVMRYRTSGGTNRYIINGEKFEGFGRSGVPLEVKEITGVRPVRIGDLEFNLNIAEQLSGPFLGSSVSAPARAKVLGKLAGTEEIDYANRLLGTDLYRRNQDEKRLAAEVAGLDESIKEYDWLPDAARKIEALEGLVKKIKAAQERREKLVRLNEQAAQIQEKITAAQAVLYRWRNIVQAENYLSAATQKDQLSTSIRALQSRLQGVLEDIYYMKLKLVKWRNLPQAEEMLLATLDNYARKEKLVSLANRCRAQEQGIKACQEIILRHSGLPDAEKLLLSTQNATEKVNRLQNLKTKHQGICVMVESSQKILSRLESLGTAEELLWVANTKRQHLENLKYLSKEWIFRESAIIGAQKLLDELAGVEDAGAKIALVSEKLERRKALNALRVQHEHKRQLVTGAREQVVVWENRVAELQGAYQDELVSLDMCPLCGALKNEMRIKEAV